MSKRTYTNSVRYEPLTPPVRVWENHFMEKIIKRMLFLYKQRLKEDNGVKINL